MNAKWLATVMIVLALASGRFDVAAKPFQGGVPTDAEIIQLKKNIADMEKIAPPPNYVQQHLRDIAELRLQLRDKLKLQRDAMTSYLAQVRDKVSAERVSQIERDISNKDGEITAAGEALLSLITKSLPAVPTQPESTPDGTTAVGRREGNRTVNPQAAPKVGRDIVGNTVEIIAGNTLQPLDATGASGALASGAEAAGDQELLAPCAEINVANASQYSQYELAICDLVKNVQNVKTGALADPFGAEPGEVSPNNPRAGIALNFSPFELQKIIAAKLIGREERGKFLIEAEEARTDKQVDGGPSNSGSTSLVVKGGAPSVLGFAVANGALVESRTGTTFTFRGNPIGIIKLLNNKTFDESYLEDENDPVTRLIKKSSFSFSFDTDRGDEPGVFTAKPQQLSAYSLRYEFLNERDPRHKKHEKKLAQFLAEHGNNLAQAIFDTYTALIVDVFTPEGDRFKGNAFRDPALQDWLEETNQLISAAAPGDVEATFKSQLDEFPTGEELTSETRDAINRFANEFNGYVIARRKLLDEIKKGSVFTFEYTNNRDVNAPDRSNFRFIAETGLLGGKADFTANASLTLFNARPGFGLSRIRDFQFAAQFDTPFKVNNVGDFVFSFAGKYERALDDLTALDGTLLPNTKGDIAVGQVKLTVPLRGSGIRIPFSVTFANRTELIREKEVRANFGFTFDLDSILARFKPF